MPWLGAEVRGVRRGQCRRGSDEEDLLGPTPRPTPRLVAPSTATNATTATTLRVKIARLGSISRRTYFHVSTPEGKASGWPCSYCWGAF